MRDLSSIALFAAVVFGHSIACAAESHATYEEPGVRGGRLVLAQKAEPKTLNPVVALDAPSKEIIRRLNADLISIDRRTLNSVPAIASAWSVSRDGKRYLVHLRKGLRFSDGHPFDASDVVFTFQLYLDEAIRFPQRDLLILNGQPISVQRLDDYTVAFVLASPYAAAERIFDSLAILPRHLLESDYRNGTLAKSWTLQTQPSKIAGLGPFRLKEYHPGEQIILERNPYYWKAGPKNSKLPYMDEIEFDFAGTEDSQLTRFLGGQSSILGRIGARNFQLLTKQPGPTDFQSFNLGPGLDYSVLFFNLTPADPVRSPDLVLRQTWFNQPEFRKAVSLAIDRTAIARLVYLGLASPLGTHVSPANTAWRNAALAPTAQSFDSARTSLKKIGFTWNRAGTLLDTKGHPVEFSILTSAGNQDRVRIATLLQDDLKHIGIKMTIASLESGAMSDRILNSRQFDAALMAIGGGEGDPNSEVNIWLSSGGMHIWNPGQKQPATPWEALLDQLIQQQMITLDRAARKRIYDRIQQIEVDQAPFIPLVAPGILAAARKRLGNFQPGIFDQDTLWNIDQLFWRPSQGPGMPPARPGKGG